MINATKRGIEEQKRQMILRLESVLRNCSCPGCYADKRMRIRRGKSKIIFECTVCKSVFKITQAGGLIEEIGLVKRECTIGEYGQFLYECAISMYGSRN